MVRFRWLALLGAALVPALAYSYTFTPQPAEWAGWPNYCKARYVTTGIGRRSPFSNSFPTAQVATFRNLIGEGAFEDVHHYCAGLAYLGRARLQADKRQKRLLLDHAFNESQYTYSRLPAHSPIQADIAVTLGMIRKEMGDFDGAIEFLNAAIEARPDLPTPYGALAMVHRAQNRLDLARDALMKGDVALKGESAEIQYNLGLVNLELGEINLALANARNAYDRGYPLPGLKKKLQDMGHWDAEPASR